MDNFIHVDICWYMVLLLRSFFFIFKLLYSILQCNIDAYKSDDAFTSAIFTYTALVAHCWMNGTSNFLLHIRLHIIHIKAITVEVEVAVAARSAVLFI